jgi:vacuolar-type H+-ATPase subunit I/STV1
LTTDTSAITVTGPARATETPFGGILRDIARGGITGAIVGLVVAGIGGRVAMRLAALAVPDAVGAFTENGNRIGEVTLGGSIGLGVFGLVAGLFVAPIWVVISPWIGGAGIRRAVLVMPIAVALGGFALIDGDNQDFRVLRHDPVVVSILVALVALFGFVFALVDEALDRRLPTAVERARGVYLLLATVGTVLVLPLLVLSFLNAAQPTIRLVGVALVGVGIVTLASWRLRVLGRPQPGWMLPVGRGAVVLAVAMGFAGVIPEVAEVLGR